MAGREKAIRAEPKAGRGEKGAIEQENDQGSMGVNDSSTSPRFIRNLLRENR